MKKSVDYKKLPYFETKVVKVKQEKEIDYFCKVDKGDWCGKCPRRPIYKKGNWVNGENLDKIKFPVLCSYKYFGKTRYAILSKGAEVLKSPTKYPYSLIDIEGQDYISESFEEYDLEEINLMA